MKHHIVVSVHIKHALADSWRKFLEVSHNHQPSVDYNDAYVKIGALCHNLSVGFYVVESIKVDLNKFCLNAGRLFFDLALNVLKF